MRTHTISLWLAALLTASSVAVSHAQDGSTYPTKPIRVVVPTGAGAGLDIAARLASAAIEGQLGRRLIIENKPGAAQRLGTSLVAKSAPDGYTLLFSTPTPITVTENFPPKLDYNPGRDLTPIAIVVRQAFLLIVRPSLNVRTLDEFIAFARSRPGKISFGVQGFGSEAHVMLEVLKKRAAVDMTPIPYNAAAQAILDLLSDRLDAMFLAAAPVKTHINSGRLLALATLGERRHQDFPNVPTMIELGLPEVTFTPWFGYLAPAGTPPMIVNRLFDAIRALPSDHSLVQHVAELGAELDIAGPAQFGAIVAAERRHFADVVAGGDFNRTQ